VEEEVEEEVEVEATVDVKVKWGRRRRGGGGGAYVRSYGPGCLSRSESFVENLNFLSEELVAPLTGCARRPGTRCPLIEARWVQAPAEEAAIANILAWLCGVGGERMLAWRANN